MRPLLDTALPIGFGAVAQLGERDVRNVEARGSIPLCSTILDVPARFAHEGERRGATPFSQKRTNTGNPMQIVSA